MGVYKEKFKTILCMVIGMIFILATTMPIKAELNFIEQEKDFIELNSIVKSVSDEGTVPFDANVTFSIIMNIYGNQIITITILIMLVIFLGVVTIIREKDNLKLQNKRYELLSNIANEYLYEYHFENNRLDVTDKYTNLFDTKEEFNEASNILKESLLSRDLEENMEQINLPLANGEIGVFRAINSIICNNKGRKYSIIGKLIDVSEEVEERKELITSAQIDGLTGLYNSTTTKQLINESIKNRNKDKRDALITIDFDKFKDINDTFGHLVGDEILKLLSKVLKITFRESDIIGRIGGDEFCVYMKNISSIEDAKLKCKQLNEIIQERNKEFYISISAGITSLKEEITYEELFKKADDALYQAKKSDRGKVRVYIEKEQKRYFK